MYAVNYMHDDAGKGGGGGGEVYKNAKIYGFGPSTSSTRDEHGILSGYLRFLVSKIVKTNRNSTANF